MVTLTLPGNSTLFEKQTYLGSEVSYSFRNKDNLSYPTMGLDVNLTAGYKSEISNSHIKNKFGYISSYIALDHKLNKSSTLVFATKIGLIIPISF